MYTSETYVLSSCVWREEHIQLKAVESFEKDGNVV